MCRQRTFPFLVMQYHFLMNSVVLCFDHWVFVKLWKLAINITKVEFVGKLTISLGVYLLNLMATFSLWSHCEALNCQRLFWAQLCVTIALLSLKHSCLVFRQNGFLFYILNLIAWSTGHLSHIFWSNANLLLFEIMAITTCCCLCLL